MKKLALVTSTSLCQRRAPSWTGIKNTERRSTLWTTLQWDKRQKEGHDKREIWQLKYGLGLCALKTVTLFSHSISTDSSHTARSWGQFGKKAKMCLLFTPDLRWVTFVPVVIQPQLRRQAKTLLLRPLKCAYDAIFFFFVLFLTVPSLSITSHDTSCVTFTALYLFSSNQPKTRGKKRVDDTGSLPFVLFFLTSMISSCPFLLHKSIFTSFGLTFWHHMSNSNILSHWLNVSFREQEERAAKSGADRPQTRRCTSWWRCWGSVWQGAWSGHGTVPCIPPLWELWAEFGRRSGTCCPLPVALFLSLLQIYKSTKLKTQKHNLQKNCW